MEKSASTRARQKDRIIETAVTGRGGRSINGVYIAVDTCDLFFYVILISPLSKGFFSGMWGPLGVLKGEEIMR